MLQPGQPQSQVVSVAELNRIARELLEPNDTRAARCGVSENCTADSAEANYTDVVCHRWRKNFRSFVPRARSRFDLTIAQTSSTIAL